MRKESLCYKYFHVQVYERFGKELCIVVTNLNQMSVEYFHPKTTPNTPVRRAVRMSVALPGKSSESLLLLLLLLLLFFKNLLKTI